MSVAIMFAGAFSGCIAIGSATLDYELAAVQASHVRDGAMDAALAGCQGGLRAAYANARSNGVRLSGVSLVPGSAGPPYVPAQITLTASIQYQPVFYPGTWSVTATVSAVGASPGKLAAVTNIQ